MPNTLLRLFGVGRVVAALVKTKPAGREVGGTGSNCFLQTIHSEHRGSFSASTQRQAYQQRLLGARQAELIWRFNSGRQSCPHPSVLISRVYRLPALVRAAGLLPVMEAPLGLAGSAKRGSGGVRHQQSTV